METDLIENNQYDESKSGIFVILSFFSWIILLITCWMPFLSLGTNKSKLILYFHYNLILFLLLLL